MKKNIAKYVSSQKTFLLSADWRLFRRLGREGGARPVFCNLNGSIESAWRPANEIFRWKRRLRVKGVLLLLEIKTVISEFLHTLHVVVREMKRPASTPFRCQARLALEIKNIKELKIECLWSVTVPENLISYNFRTIVILSRGLTTNELNYFDEIIMWKFSVNTTVGQTCH